MLENHEFYINGQWVAPQQGTKLEVLDPSTEDTFGSIMLGSKVDTDIAVAAAKSALPAWAATAPAERLEVVKRIRDIYQDRVGDIAAAISQEMGAPIDMARQQQAPAGLKHITSFIRAAENFEYIRLLGDHAPNDRIIMDPVGVVAMITPWNWPMNQITLKVIPALLAGCTMVLKPSEIAPMNAILFAEILHEAGVPSGVFNLVNGDGPGVGTQLSGHPDVDMVSFTGSTRAGRLISKNAAETLKKVHLELGGKGANIVFADADDKAVQRGALHCFNNTGQSCNAPTRMLVERSIYEQAVKTAAATAQNLEVGPAGTNGRHIGPAVSASQFEKIQNMIQIGIDEGARLVAGGTGRPDGMNRGYFCRPTVFADVNNQMTIAREEIFGPVLSIIPFDTEEEAIQIANDTPYGLTDYVQSGNEARRNRLALSLRAGMVEMNGQQRGAGAPFGGVKASGNGREGGTWGLEDFCEIKSVSGWGS